MSTSTACRGVRQDQQKRQDSKRDEVLASHPHAFSTSHSGLKLGNNALVQTHDHVSGLTIAAE